MQISTLAAIRHRLRFPSKWHRASGRAAPAPTHWPSIASQIAHVLRPWPAYDRAESAPRVSPKRTRRRPPPLPPLLPLSPSFLQSRARRCRPRESCGANPHPRVSAVAAAAVSLSAAAQVQHSALRFPQLSSNYKAPSKRNIFCYYTIRHTRFRRCCCWCRKMPILIAQGCAVS